MKRIIAHILVVALLALATGCQTIAGRFNTPALPEKGAQSASGQSKELFTKQQLFINAAVAAQNAPTDKGALLRYFETGVMLSDAICNDWFSTHFQADRETNHTKGLMNIVGSTTVGVLGFTGAESKQLGIFGLGLAGLNAEFENYMAYYLLSPAIPQIKKKLNEGRVSYANRIREGFTNTTDITYPAVQRALAGYHDLCSRIEIQRIITESVELAQYKVPETKPAKSLTAGEAGSGTFEKAVSEKPAVSAATPK